MTRKVLITGGAGFIGTNLVKHLSDQDFEIVVIDNVQESWNRQNFCALTQNMHVRLYATDLCDTETLNAILRTHSPDWVLHLAAESHVDKSIADPKTFIRSNIDGTYSLLEAVLHFWNQSGNSSDFRFHYCSTDEVYGSLGPVGSFHEEMPLHPNNPYSASKAAGEHLATAWANTCKLPVLITRCSNNFGPWQGPDKFIPLTIGRCLRKEPILIHGNGQNVRDWLFVEDHVRAIQAVLESGTPGEIYNIGGGREFERSNLDMAEWICETVAQEQEIPKQSLMELITFTKDRPGNDLRYSMNSEKLYQKTGWKPCMSLEIGLRQTARWYIQNTQYCTLNNERERHAICHGKN